MQGIRPCFRNCGFFVIIVYQLMLAARAASKKLIVCACTPQKQRILRSCFVISDIINDKKTPDYQIDCQHDMSVYGVTITDKGLHLNAEAFPTTTQLNQRICQHPFFLRLRL